MSEHSLRERLDAKHDEGKVLILDGGIVLTASASSVHRLMVAQETTIRERLVERYGEDAKIPFHLDTRIQSAILLRDAPELVYEMHAAFARAGAEVLTTATYQATLSAAAKAFNLLKAESAELLRRAPRIALQAAEGHSAPSKHPRPLVALSMSSYGATLSGAREYCGNYESPYAPAVVRGSLHHDEVVRREAEAETALTHWHLEQLRTFCDAEENCFDMIAFETVPLLREVRAIRAAVAKLEELTGKSWPFVIYNVVQGGLEEGATIADLVATQLTATPPRAIHGVHYAVPDALAINCTATFRIPSLIPQLAQGLRELDMREVPLMIAPNRSYEDCPEKASVNAWLDTMGNIVALAEREGNVFGALAMGGCCGTDPACIDALNRRLNQL